MLFFRFATIAALAVSCGCAVAVSAAPFAGPELKVTIRGYNGHAMEPFITKDGRHLLFNNRNEPPAETNLRFARRVDDVTFDYAGELMGANSTALDGVPSLDRDGCFYFVSTRSYSNTLSTLYRGRFDDGVVSGVELLPGVSPLRPGFLNFDAEISGDGGTLFFNDGDYRSGQLTAARLVVAMRQDDGFARAPDSDTMLAQVNTGGLNYAPAVSSDGLELFFTRLQRRWFVTKCSIWRATRSGTAAAFGVPLELPGPAGFVEAPSLSADGRLLYYHKKERGRFVIRCVRR